MINVQLQGPFPWCIGYYISVTKLCSSGTGQPNQPYEAELTETAASSYLPEL